MRKDLLKHIKAEFHRRGRDEHGAILSNYVHHYMVHKKSGVTVDIQKFVNVIVAYVQTHEVYFKYAPNFVEGVFVFGVVGYKKDHTELQKVLGEALSQLGCILEFTEGEELPHDEIIQEDK